MGNKEKSVATRGLSTALLATLSFVAGAILTGYIDLRFHQAEARDEFRINSFDRMSNEFLFDQGELRAIRAKLTNNQPLTEVEIKDYLAFFEGVGLYYDQKMIDYQLLKVMMGPAIVECYENKTFRTYVDAMRKQDSSYYSYFVEVAIQLEKDR
jgi:hypothetical protein